MVPENNEYEEFGRSTKLLLHPKDVPELHFPRESNTNSTEQIDINNITEYLVETATGSHKTSEIPSESRADGDDNALDSWTKEIRNSNEISPEKGDISVDNCKREPQEGSWFPFSTIGVSKLSNALKEGMFSKEGGSLTDMATRLGPTSEGREFSFFL